MALSNLNWKLLPPQVVTVNNVNSILDNFYTMFSSGTYADGSTRTPGSGSAWTWGRDTTNTFQTGVTTALYGTPPVDAIGHRVCMAASTNAGATSKQFIDTYTANIVMIGTAKNAGVYGNWTSASTPFTTGYFTGFVHAGRGTGVVTISTVYVWESQECIAIQMIHSSGSVSEAWAGAFIDPLSSNSLNAESDGRLYGVMTTGSGAVAVSARNTSSTIGGFWHLGSSTNAHCGVFVPGSATVQTTLKGAVGTNNTIFSSTLTSKNGDIPRLPIPMAYSVSPFFAGQLRQIYMTRNAATTGLTWSLSGVAQGYILTSSSVASSEAYVVTV
jgi:hypothetical protein